MNSDTTYNKKLLQVCCVYSFLFLLFVIASVFILKSDIEPNVTRIEQISAEPQYIYVREDAVTEEIYYDEKEIFIVREHMGRIGIFSSDGTLIEMIDVYVKTLPIADRSLLEEGFEVVGKQRLYSIIEDYSV